MERTTEVRGVINLTSAIVGAVLLITPVTVYAHDAATPPAASSVMNDAYPGNGKSPFEESMAALAAAAKKAGDERRAIEQKKKADAAKEETSTHPLLACASAGQRLCQLEVGKAYAFGLDGQPKDYERALFWLKQKPLEDLGGGASVEALMIVEAIEKYNETGKPQYLDALEKFNPDRVSGAEKHEEKARVIELKPSDTPVNRAAIERRERERPVKEALDPAWLQSAEKSIEEREQQEAASEEAVSKDNSAERWGAIADEAIKDRDQREQEEDAMRRAAVMGDDNDLEIYWRKKDAAKHLFVLCAGSGLAVLLVFVVYRCRQKLLKLAKSCLGLFASRKMRAAIAIYILWVLLLLFTNSLLFEDMFEWGTEYERRFWLMATLPPAFILVAYLLYRWAARPEDARAPRPVFSGQAPVRPPSKGMVDKIAVWKPDVRFYLTALIIFLGLIAGLGVLFLVSFKVITTGGASFLWFDSLLILACVVFSKPLGFWRKGVCWLAGMLALLFPVHILALVIVAIIGNIEILLSSTTEVTATSMMGWSAGLFGGGIIASTLSWMLGWYVTTTMQARWRQRLQEPLDAPAGVPAVEPQT